ncbi:transcription initiation factor IIB [Nitrososphaera sp. AFS]|uniref:transcription initiation factor IIB n=1 Tax=Nitrososphaera sp. AFS TaxID=2301191 RepID=UPI001392438A|nr:TFIIB-type zinc ribbon-containing protein [Nitrososphaera sp. AFS]NAL78444.1 transcription initiation factor IIB [Nitrososphaera sp. AFS]
MVISSDGNSSDLDSTVESGICPLCKQPNTIIADPKSTDIVCSKCGMVLSDNADTRLEWQAIDKDRMQASTRTGTGTGPLLSLARYNMGLSTSIGNKDIDANENQIKPTMLYTMRRLRTWDLRTQSNNYYFMVALRQLDTLKDKLGLSDAIVEKAAYIFRKAHEKGIIRGRSTIAVLAAVVYIACRQMDAPRTLDEIALTSNIKRKLISKCYRELVFELELRLPAIDNKKCIVRVANKANISEKTKYKAMNLMSEVVKRGISTGKDPMGLAAAVLYASCVMNGEQKSQVDLANAAQITQVTIRNRFKDLANRLELHN